MSSKQVKIVSFVGLASFLFLAIFSRYLQLPCFILYLSIKVRQFVFFHLSRCILTTKILTILLRSIFSN